MKKYMIFLMAVLTISSVSVFAQEKAGKKDTTQKTALYACPMHPDYKMNKAGTCPTCGMDLVISKKEEMKQAVTKNFQCPVHLDVVSENSGKCPKCSKKSVLSKKEQMKAEVMKIYSCPMHADVKSDKPGKCPKCDMDLTMKKEN